nr:glycerate kinase [Streptomyces clavuligerus]
MQHSKITTRDCGSARARGIEVAAVCGRLALTPGELERLGIRRAYPLLELEPDPAHSLAGAGALLERVAERIAADFAL